ncbi:MAG: hypothetical protein KDA58_13700, partial [Planctomycetaceae bacterium]|nr:hypothetical protein [Planctomycetaceae bacterium]
MRIQNHLSIVVLLLATFGQRGLEVGHPLYAEELSPNVHLRGNFQNSRIRFEREHVGHVAFIGGSITEMEGYRPLVCKD